jgi:hypothetical protein
MTRPSLVRTYVGLFAASSGFPLAASVVPPLAVTRWVGVLDVTLAFLVVLVGIRIVLAAAAPSAEDNRRAIATYRAIASVPLVLLVVFFVAGTHVRWDVLLPGLAWRGWLLMYSLPAVFAFQGPFSSADGR